MLRSVTSRRLAPILEKLRRSSSYFIVLFLLLFRGFSKISDFFDNFLSLKISPKSILFKS